MLTDPIVAANTDFVITYWNRAATRLYGWEEKEVIGKKIDEIVQVSLPNISRAELRQEVLRTGSWRGEALHYDRNHTEIVMDWSLCTFKDVNAKVIGTVSICPGYHGGKKGGAGAEGERTAIPDAGKDPAGRGIQRLGRLACRFL